MGVGISLVNFNNLFRESPTRDPIVVNDFSESSEDDKDRLNRLILTKYTTDDLLSNLPTCECGEVLGEHNVGVNCRNCGTLCTSPVDQTLMPIVWMRRPKGVEQLINPIVWTMINDKFRRSGFEIIRWICDRHYKPPVKMPPVMEQVMALGIDRGYNNFVKNFQQITDSLFELKVFKLRKGQMDPLQVLFRQAPECLFADYLPLINRSLLVIEESNVGTYVDPIATDAVDAIRTMVGIDSPLSSHNTRVKENRTVRAIAKLADFYDDFARTTLAKKEGIFRKHVYGTRSHFSFRAVISSLTAAHDYEELHIPWGIGVSVLRVHLINKLYRRGMTPNEAASFLDEHAQKHHPLLEELFQLLIDECPYMGVPVVFQRNPSLERGSAQAMYVTHVKTDVMIPTVSMSILDVVGYNA
jgi:hypothetical protein